MSLQEWAGISAVALALFMSALAPKSPSLIWSVGLMTSWLAAGIAVMEGTLRMQGRSLYGAKGETNE